jgi:HKD family nuclease
VTYCATGCFNTNAAKVYPFAINHEKFLTVSDTTWSNSAKGPHPAILSMSGNFARSQLRNYHQEVTLIYDDVEMFRQFDLRYDGMKYCATSGCSSSSGFPAGLKLSKQRGIWVDPIYRHYTDAGRGTSVSFSPQTPTAVDFYVQQFNDVDCAVDHTIRIAMFKLTDSKAEQMVNALVRLRDRGCDIKMLLTYQGGSTTISPTVAKLLTKAKIPTRCTVVAMHTKLILIGPDHNVGRVLTGTQNMSVSGLRYNEEHVLTLDSRRTSEAYQEPMRRVYEEYMNGWYELSQSTRSCT